VIFVLYINMLGGGGAAPSTDTTPKFVTECCIMIND